MDKGYIEFYVKKKREGSFKLLCVLYYAFFITAPVIAIAVLFFLGQPELLLAGSAAVCGIFGFGAYITHKFISVEYEYLIVGGEMTVDIIYGGSMRKTVTEINLKEVKLCLPVNSDSEKEIEEQSYDKLYNISASKDSESAYFMLWETEGKKKAMIFDTDERVRALLSGYCRPSRWNNL